MKSLRSALTSDAVCADVAARWARSLGMPVRLAVLPEVAALPFRPNGGLPVAVARFVGAGALALHAHTHLLAGQVQALAGLGPRPSGPVPLSSAEAGLFAYLALEALAALPEAALFLAGVDDAPAPALRPVAAWTAQLGAQRGLLLWTTPEPGPDPRVTAVPISLRVTRVCNPPAGALRTGAALLVDGAPWSVSAAGRLLFRAALTRPAGPSPWSLHVAPTGATVRPPKEFAVALDPSSLPCALTLDLGTIVLPAGVVADLAPGARIPLDLAAPPRVWLRAGETVVAEGELVDLDGTHAVRITRSLVGA